LAWEDSSGLSSLIFRNYSNPATMAVDLKKPQALPLRIYFLWFPLVWGKEKPPTFRIIS